MGESDSSVTDPARPPSGTEALARAAQADVRRAQDRGPTDTSPPSQSALMPLTELLIQRSPLLRGFAEALGALALPYLALTRQLVEALRGFRDRNREVLSGLARIVTLDPVLVDYCCGAYAEEMRELGAGPLSDDQQREFLVATIALWPDQGDGPDQRPPLLAVALACGRPDIAAAIIQKAGLPEKAARSTSTSDPEVRAELPEQALTLLLARTLPWLSRRAGETGLAEVSTRLRGFTSDAYLYKSIHNELRRYLGRRRKAEAQLGKALERAAAQQMRREQASDPAKLAETRAVLARFARRGSAKVMDRRLVQAFLADPRRSARSLALEWGQPERTVRYRRRLMLAYLQEKLGEEVP